MRYASFLELRVSDTVGSVGPTLYQRVDVQLVISEVTPSSPQSLQAVKLLAQYFGSKEDKVYWDSISIIHGLNSELKCILSARLKCMPV